MALAFLVHFVGDLHQPIHAGDHGDLGGNRVAVSYGIIAGRTNLHPTWDGYLADRGISTPPADAAGLLAELGPADKAAMRSAASPTGRAKAGRRAANIAYGTDPRRPLRRRRPAERAGDHRGDHPTADPDRPPPGRPRRTAPRPTARRGASDRPDFREGDRTARRRDLPAPPPAARPPPRKAGEDFLFRHHRHGAAVLGPGAFVRAFGIAGRSLPQLITCIRPPRRRATGDSRAPHWRGGRRARDYIRGCRARRHGPRS